MSHERPVEPFSDLHVEDGSVRATLLHDPTVEGLDMAIYMDGSGSMKEEYEYKTRRTRHLLAVAVRGAPTEVLPNQVEPQVQWMLEYLATKDRNGILRVAYWACGATGTRGRGDRRAARASTSSSYKFPGPKEMGRRTHLAPAMRDYVKYLKAQVPQGARRGCAVFVTDGAAPRRRRGRSSSRRRSPRRSPRAACRASTSSWSGVGDDVNEEQMEEICHAEYPGRRPPVVPPHRRGDQPGRRAGRGAGRRDHDGRRRRHHLRRQGQGAEGVRGPPARGAGVRRARGRQELHAGGATASATRQPLPDEEHHDEDDDDATTAREASSWPWRKHEVDRQAVLRRAPRRATRSSPRCCTIRPSRGSTWRSTWTARRAWRTTYGPRGVLAKLAPVRNQVEPQMRWMLEYLATKDRDGVLRVAYWATGRRLAARGGRRPRRAAQAQTYKFPGPRFYGKGTVMLPVLRDYVALHPAAGGRRARGAGLAVIITDSQLYDADGRARRTPRRWPRRSPPGGCRA